MSWGDCELMSLQVGELVGLWVGKVMSWGDCELMGLWVDEFASWWVCKLVSWWVDELVGWWVDWCVGGPVNSWIVEFMSFLVCGLCELEPYQHVHLSTRQLVNLSTRQPVNSLTSQFVNSFPCLLVTPSLLTYPFTILLAIIVIEPIGVAVNTAKGVDAFGTILVFVL